eukprot:1525264-Amphidinium_carterae.1
MAQWCSHQHLPMSRALRVESQVENPDPNVESVARASAEGKQLNPGAMRQSAEQHLEADEGGAEIGEQEVEGIEGGDRRLQSVIPQSEESSLTMNTAIVKRPPSWRSRQPSQPTRSGGWGASADGYWSCQLSASSGGASRGARPIEGNCRARDSGPIPAYRGRGTTMGEHSNVDLLSATASA